MNRPPVMILLGFFSTAIAGAASGTVNADDVPRMNVHELNNSRLAAIYAANAPEGSLPTVRAEDDANAPNERHERGIRDGAHRAGARGSHRRGQRRTGCREA